MPKLKAFIAEQGDDHRCFNILAKTKKDMVQQMEDSGHVTYTRAAQVVLEYRDGFELAKLLTGESGGREIGWPFSVVREYTTPLCKNHVPD